MEIITNSNRIQRQNCSSHSDYFISRRVKKSVKELITPNYPLCRNFSLCGV